jgi:uncharacterized repeat protein (TIGR03803 family)
MTSIGSGRCSSTLSVAALVGAAIVANLSLYGHALAYTEKTLFQFCDKASCRDGDDPGGLVIGQDGNFFGVTAFGGNSDSNDGVVFELVPSTGQYTVIYEFCKEVNCPDGAHPESVNLVVDTSGNLYGTTSAGGVGSANDGGVVFELVRKGSGWREKTLYTFCSRKNCGDGGVPVYGLTYAGAASGPYDGTSQLFGTTEYGGAEDEGTPFSLAPKAGKTTWAENVLYSFCSEANCSDGSQPDSPLYIDGGGNLYGTAQGGGQSTNTGVVFEISPSGSGYTESVPYAFCSQSDCADGAYPDGGVARDTSGSLYGTTLAGGDGDQHTGNGVLFKLTAEGSQWDYTNLADFGGKTGEAPSGGLLIDPSGSLFGTTFSGATLGKGNVFEFNGTLQNLHSFCDRQGKCTDGDRPASGVIEDGLGNLYGVTSSGGNRRNGGTIFELSP